MLTSPRPWLWIGAVIAGAALALALGVPPGALLIAAAVLACPIAMYFGMRGMRGPQDAGAAARHSTAAAPEPRRAPGDADADARR